jgi:hypothetical protein
MIAAAFVAAGASQGFAQQPSGDIVAALDTNHDGVVSTAEFSAMTAARFSQSDANGDGKLTGDERSNYHGKPGPEQTKTEFMAQSLRVFESEDSDHDGRIADDEVGRFRAHIEGGSRPLPTSGN